MVSHTVFAVMTRSSFGRRAGIDGLEYRFQLHIHELTGRSFSNPAFPVPTDDIRRLLIVGADTLTPRFVLRINQKRLALKSYGQTTSHAALHRSPEEPRNVLEHS